MKHVTEHLINYLSTNEVTELNNDLDFKSTIESINEFIKTTSSAEMVAFLDNYEQDQYKSTIDNIEQCLKNYVVNRNNQFCVLINHYISIGYNLFFKKYNDFNKRFTEISMKHGEQLEELSTKISEKETQFTKSITRLKNAEDKADSSIKHIDEQLKKALDIANDWLIKVTNDNEKILREKKIEIEKHTESFKKRVDEDFRNILSNFEEFKQKQIDEFNIVDKKREKFLEMYEIGIRYSGEARFDEYSVKEGIIADNYRKVSIGLMILVVLFIGLLTIINLFFKADSNWYQMVSRFLLVFSLMIPAVYTTRESSRHRRNSDKYAQMGNELKAFTIAIGADDMPIDTKNRIKEAIFKRYFGNIFADKNIDKNIADDMHGVFDAFRPKEKQNSKSKAAKSNE